MAKEQIEVTSCDVCKRPKSSFVCIICGGDVCVLCVPDLMKQSRFNKYKICKTCGNEREDVQEIIQKYIKKYNKFRNKELKELEGLVG